MDAREHLAKLRDELHRREFYADLGGTDDSPLLHVRNPMVTALSDTVHCTGDQWLRWSNGVEIGPVEDIKGNAERIVYVLRPTLSGHHTEAGA